MDGNKIEENDKLDDTLSELYDELQLLEINKGKDVGIDTSIYEQKDYNFLQMEQIRLGLEAGIDVESYAKPQYNYLTMKEIRLGLQEGIDVSDYVIGNINGLILKEIRKSKKKGIDIIPYVMRGYDSEQLHQIRKALEAGIVDIKKYIRTDFNGAQINEIAIGIDNRVDVSVYATGEFNWLQMREIRIGLEESLDVSHYARKLASYGQMQEIRIGLEQGVDVEKYSSLINTQYEMAEMRQALVEDKQKIQEDKDDKIEKEHIEMSFSATADKEKEDAEEYVENGNITFSEKELEKLVDIRVTDDFMNVYVVVHNINSTSNNINQTQNNANLMSYITKSKLIKFLRNHNVKYGILEDVIDKILENNIFDEEVLVAKGKECHNGANGEYKFYFPIDLSVIPRLEDGSVNYTEMNIFAFVEKDKLIAEYIPPQRGTYGVRVDGSVIRPKAGEELPMLRGRGFYMSKDCQKYFASFSGRIDMKSKYELDVLKMLLLHNVDLSTGNIYFDGDVMVMGDVRNGFHVSATGDIVVNGHVEESMIECDGNVVIKQGMHGNYNGTIKAKGNVYGTFFESVNVVTDSDFNANYILNCGVNALGKVKLSGKKGSIAGGNVYGALGVEAYRIGNESQIRTVVQTGIKKSFVEDFMKVSKKCEKIESEINLLADNKEKLSNNNVSSIDKVILMEKIDIAHRIKSDEYSECDKERERLKNLIEMSGVAKVVAMGTVYKGTEVFIQTQEYVVNHDLSNICFYNEKGKGVVAKTNDYIC